MTEKFERWGQHPLSGDIYCPPEKIQEHNRVIEALEAERAAHRVTQQRFQDGGLLLTIADLKKTLEDQERQLAEARAEIACAENGPICCKSCSRSHHYECNVKVREERDTALREKAEAGREIDLLHQLQAQWIEQRAALEQRATEAEARLARVEW